MKKEKKGTAVAGKPISKKTGITIFTLIMLIMGVIIVFYHNPLADPVDELLKKIIACVLIVRPLRCSPGFMIKSHSCPRSCTPTGG